MPARILFEKSGVNGLAWDVFGWCDWVRMHEECRGLSTLPPGSVPSIGGAFQQLGMAMGG